MAPAPVNATPACGGLLHDRASCRVFCGPVHRHRAGLCHLGRGGEPLYTGTGRRGRSSFEISCITAAHPDKTHGWSRTTSKPQPPQPPQPPPQPPPPPPPPNNNRRHQTTTTTTTEQQPPPKKTDQDTCGKQLVGENRQHGDDDQREWLGAHDSSGLASCVSRSGSDTFQLWYCKQF